MGRTLGYTNIYSIDNELNLIEDLPSNFICSSQVETQSAVITDFRRFFGQVEFFIFTPVPNITCNQSAFQAIALTARFQVPIVK